MIDSANIKVYDQKLNWSFSIPEYSPMPQPSALAGIDVNALRNRDRILLYRDLLVAQLLNTVVERFKTATGISIPNLQLQSKIETKLLVSNLLVGTTDSSGALTGTLKQNLVKGLISLLIGSEIVTDDENGNLTGAFTTGTIDYVNGTYSITAPTLGSTNVYASYSYVLYIADNPVDYGDLGNTTPGVVSLVNNSDTINKGLSSDRDLYSRDLTLHEVIATLDKNFTKLASKLLPHGSIVVDSQIKDVIATLGKLWSLAEGILNDTEISESIAYSVKTIKDPDTNLSYRDNLIAKLAARLSSRINPISLFELADRLYVQLPSAEPETYVFTKDSGRYRLFNAEPILSDKQLSIEYDKVLKTVRYYDSVATPLTSQPVSTTMNFDGITANVILNNPQSEDSAFYCQKAGQINPYGFQEDVIFYQNNGYPSKLGFTPKISQATIYNGNAVLSRNASTAAFDVNLVPPLPTTSKQEFVELSFLLRAPKTLILKGKDYYIGACTTYYATVSSDSNAALLPVAYPNNYFYEANNNPKIGWKVQFTPGTYLINIKWSATDLAAISVTLRLGSTVIWVGQLRSQDANIKIVTQTSNISILDTTEQLLTLSINEQSGTGQLIIHELEFNRIVNSGTDTHAVSITLEDPVTAASFALVPKNVQYEISFNDYVIISTGWIDLSTLLPVTTFRITATSDITIPAEIVSLSAKKLSRVTVTPESTLLTGWRYGKLKQAESSIQDRFLELVSYFDPSDTVPSYLNGGYWTSKSTASWLTDIESLEPRLYSAVRLPTPSDIGRPCLVPLGLEWDGINATNALSWDKCLPKFAQLQPWMITLGFLVAKENFWDSNGDLIRQIFVDIVDDGINPNPIPPEIQVGISTQTDDVLLTESGDNIITET